VILKKLYLKNFRAYPEIEFDFNEKMNVIIGKNDIGKSTVLDALEIFLNNDIVKIDISDFNVFASEKFMTIGCVFDIDKTKEYIIDTIPTNLKKEFLLNKNGELEIHQTWDCSKNKLSASSLKVNLIANYPINHKKILPILKIEDLKKELNQYSSELDIESIKKNTSSEIRKAIYSVTDTVDLEEKSISLVKDNGKKIWESLRKELPLYNLFQSDRLNKDSDKEVQEPLKAITKTAINEVIDQLDEIKKIIEEKAIQIGKDTIEKLEEMNPEIAKVLNPDIKNKAWDTLFSFSFKSDDGIPVNKRGSGIRRLILLNYFRAEAERQNTSNKNIIYAIEEPETSQHPNHQELLIKALIELSQKDKNQLFITTHTPEIAKIVKDENLIFIENVDGNPKINKSDSKLNEIAKTLGIMPYLSKLVVCVEGEFDIKFITNINQAVEEFRSIIDLKEKNISIIPLHGGNLKNWVERNYLQDSNVVEFHIYDRDSNSGRNAEQYKKQHDEINDRDDDSVCLLTNKREIENYIPRALIETEFCIDCSSISDWDEEDIPTYISNKTSLNEKTVKEILNGRLARQITKVQLEELNAFEEIKSWFKQIKAKFE